MRTWISTHIGVRNALILTVLGVILLALVLGMFVVRPAWQTATTEAQTAQRLQSQEAVLQQRLTALQRANEKKADTQAQLDQLQQAVPDSSQYQQYLLQLNGAAQTAGATIVSANWQDAVLFSKAFPAKAQQVWGKGAASAASKAAVDQFWKNKQFVGIPLDVTVQGTQDQVHQFVHNAQNTDRIFWVNSLIYQQNQQQNGNDGGAGYQVTVKGFVFQLGLKN
ncbi:MAG: hypothetical protein ABF811_09065 [Pseudoclavibacter sp.]|jgi:Tfp pilus assembly protein PilO